MHRRDFFKRSVGGLSLAALLPISALTQYKALTTGVQLLRTAQGQTIEDILISFGDSPMDVAHLIKFFRSSTPNTILLNLALNQRATFRWAAAPGLEILLSPSESLQWTQETAGYYGKGKPPKPLIWTQGRDRATGAVIVNQSIYANEHR